MSVFSSDLASRDGGRGGARYVWLLYLAIYVLPWLVRAPGAASLGASLAGVAVFLLVYFDAYRGWSRAPLLLHVALMAAIGFALAPFGGAWSVFNVFASSLAARAWPRPRAWAVLAALQAALVGYGLAIHAPWEVWASGVFFGVMAGFGVRLQADLEGRNRRLVETQGEVRRLAAAAERERIGRDLHDLLGHTLTLVAVKADLAARLVEGDPAAGRREMEEVAAAAREALGEVRAAVSGMRGASLAREVERARAMLAAARVEATVDAADAPPDPRAEAVLAMALREAVTNVIRHAGATRCAISVEREAGGLRLLVADDGRGAGAVAEGSGLSGMRARLAAAGGRLSVERAGGGVRLVAWLPELAG